MYDACEGEDTLEVSTAIAAGIVFAQPDYPYSKATKAETLDVPIYGVTDKNRKFIAPQSVKMAKLPTMVDGKVKDQEMWATCGDYLAVVTGSGKSVKVACERAYKTLKELHVPDAMYRDDVGEGLEKSLPELQKHGYATEFTYG
jgi:phosphoribosylamine---glycine ligase